VLGVPTGLEMASRWGWRAPFLGVAVLGLLVNLGAFVLLPPLRDHLDRPRTTAQTSPTPLTSPSRLGAYLLAYGMTASAMMGGFVIIPNISAYVQFNLGFPRDRLGLMYLVGGLVSVVAMPTAGRVVDRYGPVISGAFGTFVLLSAIYLGFYLVPPLLPVPAIFVGFMLSMAFRNVAYNTLASRVPQPAERAKFMSGQSAVQHLASALAAVLSAQMLHELPDGKLVGMDQVALVALSLSALLPLLLYSLRARVTQFESHKISPETVSVGGTRSA
jgi:predicted MFS family arabinose efflux permease